MKHAVFQVKNALTSGLKRSKSHLLAGLCSDSLG
jgi:hypothetical protein